MLFWKKITESDIDVFQLTRYLDDEQLRLVRKLKWRRNKPLKIQISEVYLVMGDYAPAIVGQSLRNDVFICRKSDRGCSLSLQPLFYEALRRVWKKFHCIAPVAE